MNRSTIEPGYEIVKWTPETRLSYAEIAEIGSRYAMKQYKAFREKFSEEDLARARTARLHRELTTLLISFYEEKVRQALRPEPRT